MKEVLPYAYKQKGEKKKNGEGAKPLFQRQDTEGKRIRSFNKLKEKYSLADR